MSERGLPCAGKSLGGVQVTNRAAAAAPEARPQGPRGLVTAADLDALQRGEELHVPPGARVTELCREEADQRGIRLIEARGNTGTPLERAPGDGRPLRIALGADHGGYPLKCDLVDWVRDLGHVPLDLGTHGPAVVDYPDFAFAVARAVHLGHARFGLMLDGVGVGSAMVANKLPGVRAALCPDVFSAFNARAHNDANVLCLGGRVTGPGVAMQIVRLFLVTPFEGGRHARRVELIERKESTS